MLLSYIDESGINYSNKKGFFNDGPLLLWSAMLIPDTKYFHLERLFCELAKKELGIKDWYSVEMHACDIWSCKGSFSHITKEKARRYFEELFQLIAKLNIDILVAVEPKKANNKNGQKTEKKRCNFTLLHGLEYKLAELNQTSILIADEGESSEVLDELLYERTKWRYNPGERKKKNKLSKFNFETMSCFLLDRVHYMSSRRSLFLQISDHIAFTLQRVFTYIYLRDYPVTGIKADKNNVPITGSTFVMFGRNIALTKYNDKEKDITFYNLEQVLDNDKYLPHKILDIFN